MRPANPQPPSGFGLKGGLYLNQVGPVRPRDFWVKREATSGSRSGYPTVGCVLALFPTAGPGRPLRELVGALPELDGYPSGLKGGLYLNQVGPVRPRDFWVKREATSGSRSGYPTVGCVLALFPTAGPGRPLRELVGALPELDGYPSGLKRTPRANPALKRLLGPAAEAFNTQPDAGIFESGATRTRTGDTTIFRHPANRLEIVAFAGNTGSSGVCRLKRFARDPRGFGPRADAGGPNDRRPWAPERASSSSLTSGRRRILPRRRPRPRRSYGPPVARAG